MKYIKEIFKAYDIRGIVDAQLSKEVVNNIGKVLGTMAQEQMMGSLVVGRDGRLSSLDLQKALIDGILKSGCNVFDIGLVATPIVYYANFALKTYSGVMVTGSHNPPEYNGLKMVINNQAVYGDKIVTLYNRLLANDYIDDRNGNYEVVDIRNRYIQEISKDIKLKRKINVIVDCGNGVAGDVAPKLFRALNADVTELYCEVDGLFPHHHPDPSRPENLKDLIKYLHDSDAEIGFAFDGDGDRLGVVTKDGNIIYPDRQMMLFSKDVLQENPRAKIIYDVKSTLLLKNWITEHNGIPIISKTGHSFIKERIKKENAKLAGEMSGHIFFNDRWYGFDDGLYAGARMLEILSNTENISKLLNDLPNMISTPEINVNVGDKNPHEIIELIKKDMPFSGYEKIIDIDGLRVEYQYGFGLVRASNTMPVLVLRFEADTLKNLEIIKSQFIKIINNYFKIDSF